MKQKPFGTTHSYYDNKEGKKLHKLTPRYAGGKQAKCGSGTLKRFYDSPENFTKDELCKRCFKPELKKRQELVESFLLPEELFQI